MGVARTQCCLLLHSMCPLVQVKASRCGGLGCTFTTRPMRCSFDGSRQRKEAILFKTKKHGELYFLLQFRSHASSQRERFVLRDCSSLIAPIPFPLPSTLFSFCSFFSAAASDTGGATPHHELHNSRYINLATTTPRSILELQRKQIKKGLFLCFSSFSFSLRRSYLHSRPSPCSS